MIETYGVHSVRHGDVIDGIAELMGQGNADIMYTDPPWGDGHIKYFATLNKKMTGVEWEPVSLERFLASIFDIARQYATRYLLVEYGVRWADKIQAYGTAAGFTPREIINVEYVSGGKRRSLHLHVFTKGLQKIPANYAQSIEGTCGYETVKRAIALLAEPGYVVLDPCCGMGYTAQATVDAGLAFRGNELNRRRLDKTVARLR